MNDKHEIEIPDLPVGWKPIVYRRAERGKDYVLRDGKVSLYNGFSDFANLLVVEKIKSRRIVLEETDEIAIPKNGDWVLRGKVFQQSDGNDFRSSHRIWREIVDETSTVKEGE